MLLLQLIVYISIIISYFASFALSLAVESLLLAIWSGVSRVSGNNWKPNACVALDPTISDTSKPAIK